MELSKENQEWLDKARDVLATYPRIHVTDVKEKLLQDQQKIEELEKRIKVLTTPEGYSSEDDGYACPYDYISEHLDTDSKVGDEFSLVPYVLLPERTFRLTKLDDETGSFEYEVAEDNK